MKKNLEVFTVPTNKLLAWRVVDGWLREEETGYLLCRGWERLLRDGEIKEVQLIHNDEILPDEDEIQFTICSPEVQPAELAELRAKKESAALAVIARYRRGEITSLEALQLEFAKMERDSSDFKDFYLEADHILSSHLGRSPRAGEKITKVEVTNDGVEFTTVRV